MNEEETTQNESSPSINSDHDEDSCRPKPDVVNNSVGTVPAFSKTKGNAPPLNKRRQVAGTGLSTNIKNRGIAPSSFELTLQPRKDICTAYLPRDSPSRQILPTACRGRKRPAHSMSAYNSGVKQGSQSSDSSFSDNNIEADSRTSNFVNEISSEEAASRGEEPTSPCLSSTTTTFQGLSIQSPLPNSDDSERQPALIPTNANSPPSHLDSSHFSVAGSLCAFSKYKESPSTAATGSGAHSSLPPGVPSPATSSRSSPKLARVTLLTHTMNDCNGLDKIPNINKRPPLHAGSAFFPSLESSVASSPDVETTNVDHSKTSKLPPSAIHCRHDSNASEISAIPHLGGSTPVSSLLGTPNFPKINLTPRSSNSGGSSFKGGAMPRLPSPSDDDEPLTPVLFLPEHSSISASSFSSDNCKPSDRIAPIKDFKSPNDLLSGSSLLTKSLKAEESDVHISTSSAEGQTGAINDHVDTSIRNSSTLKHPTPPVGSLLLPTEEAQSPRNVYCDALSDSDTEGDFLLAPPEVIRDEKQPDHGPHRRLKLRKVQLNGENRSSMTYLASSGEASSTSLLGMDFISSNTNLKDMQDNTKDSATKLIASEGPTKPASNLNHDDESPESVGLVLERLNANNCDDDDCCNHDLLKVPSLPNVQSPPPPERALPEENSNANNSNNDDDEKDDQFSGCNMSTPPPPTVHASSPPPLCSASYTPPPMVQVNSPPRLLCASNNNKDANSCVGYCTPPPAGAGAGGTDQNNSPLPKKSTAAATATTTATTTTFLVGTNSARNMENLDEPRRHDSSPDDYEKCTPSCLLF